MKQLKVKPWGEGQGDHVLIDESDFNTEIHTLIDGEVAPERILVVGSSSVNVDAFRAELEAVGLIVESFAAQELTRPDGELGPVADRLLQVFESANAGAEHLQRERNDYAGKVDILQKQVDDLLAQAEQGRHAEAEAKEVAELKARLDAAKVTYRSNASKESLQKQVDELDKA